MLNLLACYSAELTDTRVVTPARGEGSADAGIAAAPANPNAPITPTAAANALVRLVAPAISLLLHYCRGRVRTNTS